MSTTSNDRPVQLQVNNSGAWKTVARFDAGDESASDKVMAAGQLLGEVQPNLTWRIATVESIPVVLMYWDQKNGWTKR